MVRTLEKKLSREPSRIPLFKDFLMGIGKPNKWPFRSFHVMKRVPVIKKTFFCKYLKLTLKLESFFISQVKYN